VSAPRHGGSIQVVDRLPNIIRQFGSGRADFFGIFWASVFLFERPKKAKKVYRI
jgi:hypothetical protein